MIKVKRLDHITITVREPERSIAFYRDILGMQAVYDWPGEITMLRAGETYLAVAWWNRERALRPQPEITVDHFAFCVDADTFNRATTELPKLGYPLDHFSDHGICQSIYIRDPDGHLVELTCYEIKGTEKRMPKAFEVRCD